MAFSTFCTNKGCNKQMEPYLEKSTDKVYCSVCDQEITSITYFAKMQMKSLNQVKSGPKIFGIKCGKCKSYETPTLIKGELACPNCKHIHTNITEYFKIAIKEQLKQGSDIK